MAHQLVGEQERETSSWTQRVVPLRRTDRFHFLRRLYQQRAHPILKYGQRTLNSKYSGWVETWSEEGALHMLQEER